MLKLYHKMNDILTLKLGLNSLKGLNYLFEYFGEAWLMLIKLLF